MLVTTSIIKILVSIISSYIIILIYTIHYSLVLLIVPGELDIISLIQSEYSNRQ